jgi:SAM-dependent methyltransferase
VVVTDEAFLHHDGGATASAQGDDWKLAAWAELVTGMRRLYGMAWPRLLRDPDARDRSEDGVRAPDTLCPPVVVVGSPGSGARTVHRALNLLGVPPAPEPDQRRLDRLAAELGLDSGAGYLPGTPDELLGAPALAAALDEVREAVGAGVRLDRPSLWRDPTGGALVPFLAAAYDVDPVCVLVVRNPLDVADELRVEGGTDRRTGLAVWERRLRLALHSLVGLPVVVTRLEDLVRLPAAWSRDLHRALTGLAVPLIAEVGEHEVVAAMRGAVRSARHVDVRTTTSQQEGLYATLLGLTGSHARFPEVALGPESPDTEDLLSHVARPSGPPLTLGPEWVDWVAENRGAGILDSELLAVLVQRGIEPAEGRRALVGLDRNGNGRQGHLNGHANGHTPVATYRSVNEQAWDLLSGTTEDFGAPVTPEDLPGARAELEGPLPIPWADVSRVLCLAGGGGRQAALFASLGLDVVVADLSSAQLALDRAAAGRLGLSLETVQADMADLSVLGERRFDLVHQPVSLCYVPDPGAVFAEVARVLEPGGHYWVESWNPVQMQLDRLGRDGPPYRLVRPQGAERPVRFGVAAEELDEAGPEIAWHYVHPLSTLLGSLCTAGFEIEDLQERRYGDADAAAGTEAHLEAFVPPFFAVLARRVGGAG